MKIIARGVGGLKNGTKGMERVRIKICGVTTVADALAAAEVGADFIGLNFYPPSPRYLAPETAGGILDALPETVEPVAVLVKPSRDALDRPIGALARFNTVQWHDDHQEPRPWLKQRLIAVFSVKQPEDLEAVKRYLEDCRQSSAMPAALLIDAHVAGLYGGTGKTAPWDLLARLEPGIPLILAGGLTPENVADAIRQVRPFAVDVASGVELAPGRKDLDKMKRFIENVRNTVK